MSNNAIGARSLVMIVITAPSKVLTGMSVDSVRLTMHPQLVASKVHGMNITNVQTVVEITPLLMHLVQAYKNKSVLL